MLRDDERLLIASGVEGPLPSTEAASLRVLLAESNEAAVLFRKLQADRDRLTTLPKRAAPSRVVRNVMLSIQPKTVPATRYTNRAAEWIPYAFAASVLIAVTCGSFVLFRNGSDDRNQAQSPLLPNRNAIATEDSKKTPLINREELPLPVSPNAVAKVPDATLRETVPKIPAEIRQNPNPDFLGAPSVGSIPNLESAAVRLPYLFPLNEAGQDETKKRIASELNRATAARIDLFSKDLVKSVESIQNASKSSHLQLSSTPQSVDLVKRKASITLAVYLDSCTATELTELLVHLAKVDEKLASFTHAHILSASPNDARELKTLLGFDPGMWKRPKPEAVKPIQDGTLGQLAQTMGKGSKSAILLTFGPNPVRILPQNSPELKLFRERLGERSSTAIPTMIVIKPIN